MARLVSVFDGKDLTYEQREEISEKLLKSVTPDTNIWDYSKRITDKSIIGYSTFDVFDHGFFYMYLCDECHGKTNLPFLKKECIICGSDKIQHHKRGVAKSGLLKGVGIIGGFNKDLYNMAQQDLVNHPVPTNDPIDWQHLSDNLD